MNQQETQEVVYTQLFQIQYKHKNAYQEKKKQTTLTYIYHTRSFIINMSIVQGIDTNNVFANTMAYVTIPVIATIVTLTILCIPTLYQLFILNFLNPFVIMKGKKKGQKVPLLGICSGTFPFGHLSTKNWKPIIYTNKTVNWCQKTKIYTWVEYVLFVSSKILFP